MYYVVDFYFYADIVGVLCVEGRIGGTKKNEWRKWESTEHRKNK